MYFRRPHPSRSLQFLHELSLVVIRGLGTSMRHHSLRPGVSFRHLILVTAAQTFEAPWSWLYYQRRSPELCLPDPPTLVCALLFCPIFSGVRDFRSRVAGVFLCPDLVKSYKRGTHRRVAIRRLNLPPLFKLAYSQVVGVNETAGVTRA
jgi:hypothetical protein